MHDVATATAECQLGPSGIDFAEVRRRSVAGRLDVLRIVETLARQDARLSHALPLLQELLVRVESMSPDPQARLLEDPVFSIWLNRLAVGAGKAASASDGGALFDEMHGELESVVDRVLLLQSDATLPRIASTSIPVQMDDLDPLIRRVTPPSFEFTGERLAVLQRERTALPWLVGRLSDAFELIEIVAPAVWGQITVLVRIVGYLPGADFRSCSAARYPSVVYLGADDEQGFEFEESIIHEAAHQYLYRIDEVDPIVDRHAGTLGDYELPWSGARRDFFGYLHACFIYVALAKYFTQRLAVTNDHASEVTARRNTIYRGLVLAIPEIDGDPALTSTGSEIVAALRHDVDQLTYV